MSPSTLRLTATCVTLLIVLTACGQKGPLRLPDEPAAQSETAQPSPNQESRAP